MRVLVSPRDSERGAVAVLVAVMATVLFVVSAFVVDLGAAYASKRQLQTGADAAALAAAAVYSKYPGTCTQLAANSTYKSEAQGAADDYRERNRPNATGGTVVVACNADKELEVTYTVTGQTSTYFGKFFGDTITASRDAAAVVDVPPSVSRGVRPYALCSADLPVGAVTNAVVEITPPGQAHGGSSCAAAESGGNWWFVTCDIPSGGTSEGSPQNMGEAIEKGCTNTISVVTPQNQSSPSSLSSSLTANCNTGSSPTASCLDGDTGNSSLKNKAGYEAWDKIIGQTIMLPVFCSTPICSPDTVNGNGTKTRYPVYAIASVVVCGYHIYDKASDSINTGDCVGNTFTQTYVAGKDKKDVYLYLKFVRVNTADTTTSTACALGTACDGGLRRVHLSQ